MCVLQSPAEMATDSIISIALRWIIKKDRSRDKIRVRKEKEFQFR